jgi:hypothetical protein
VRSSPAVATAAVVPASPAPVRAVEAAAAPVVAAASPLVAAAAEPTPLALDEDDGDIEEVQFDIVPQDAALTESIAREEVLPATAVPIASAPAMFETALPDGAPVRASIADDVEFHSAAVQTLVTADAAPTRKRKSSGEATDAIERAAAPTGGDDDDDEAQLVDDDEEEDDDDDNDRADGNNVQAESGAKPSQLKPVVKRARAGEAAESGADPVAAAALRTADERVRLAREKRAALERARADEQSRRDEVRKMRDERRRREAEEAERTKNEMKEQRRQRLEAKIRRKREEREQAIAERSESTAVAATTTTTTTTMAPSAAMPVAASRARPADEVVRKLAAAPVAAAATAAPVAQPIAQAAAAAPQLPIAAMATAEAPSAASLATPMVRKGPMALFGKLFGALGSPQATHASDKATATTVASAAAIVAASSPVRRAGPASAAAWATSAHTQQSAAVPHSKPVRDLTITAVPPQQAPPASSSSAAATGLMPPPTNYIRSPPPVNAASPRTLAAVAASGAKVSPAPESYLMSDCSEESDSAMSPETPEKRGKKVPLWAKRDALFRALQTQNVDPDEIFQDMAPPDLEEIFGAQRARYRRRASSANWTVDGLSTSENANFKRKMGFAPISQHVAQPLQPHRCSRRRCRTRIVEALRRGGTNQNHN